MSHLWDAHLTSYNALKELEDKIKKCEESIEQLRQKVYGQYYGGRRD